MTNAKITLVLLLGLICIMSLSGCDELLQQPGDGTEIRHSNDVITVERLSVSSLNPYADSYTTIEFYLRNNGEEPVERVELNFFNIQGFPESYWRLECEGTYPLDTQGLRAANGHKCIFDASHAISEAFDDIEEGDTRRVSLTLRTPSRDKIKTPTKLRVDYYINYSYFGFRKADIPIIDGVTITRPISQFWQSEPTYSPIRLDFEPPVGGVRIENEQEIKEYWGVQDRPFEVKMNFEHVGSSHVGTIAPVAIEEGDVKLDLRSALERVPDLACEFDPSGGYLYSNKRVEVPGTLVCNFRSILESPPPEITATIWAEFLYTYKFIRSQEFEVQPFLV